MNVLIVEPSRTVTSILTSLFGKYGLDTRVAKNGQHGMEMLEEMQSDLLCFAYELGDMDGVDFFTAAKSRKLVHHQPGLMFSATQRKTVINRALMAGVTECFSKRNLDQLEHFIEQFAMSNRSRISGRVLLVEDSPSAVLFYRQILERMGLQIVPSRSAEEAIEIIKSENFDLVLTDYVLAGSMSGYAVIRAIREQEGKRSLTPILVISSFDDMARKVEILRNGANDFVGKPVVAEELEVRVFNLIKSHKLLNRLEQQHTVMKDIATRDTLTGLYNRYHLNEISPGLIADALESGEKLSLIVLDADRFKKINDTFGHKTGDQVLQQIARRLQKICRADDLVARVGGEEFIVILPGMQISEAEVRAELIRKQLEDLKPCGIRVTASIGVAELASTENYDELFQRADRAMYDAKTNGRNKVEVAK